MYSNFSKDELEKMVQQARAQALADYAKNAEQNKARVESVANVQAQREAGLINDNLLDALQHGAQTGVNQIKSGFESAKLGAQHTVADVLGMDEKASELEIALKQAAQKQAQRQAEINAQYNTNFGMLAKGVSDVTSGAVGMLPTIGAAVLTPQGKVALAGKAAQVGAKALRALPTAGVMGAQATGLGINQALNEGADIGQAKAYGVGSAVKEVATELPFAGIAKVPGLVNVGQKIAGGNKIVGGVLNAATEGAEEAAAEALDPFIQRATYNPNAENASFEDMLYSALIGAGTAGLINSGFAGAGKVANTALGAGKNQKILPTAKKNMQNQGIGSQNAQNGAGQAQGVPMTNTLPTANNRAQNQSYEVEKIRKQMLAEQQNLLSQKRALEKQKAQMEQAEQDNLYREIKNLEETIGLLRGTKSPAFDNALFNAMDEYTTPEQKAEKAEFDLPMAERTLKNVSNPKVKAYQSTHPEVKAFFREQAEIMLNDLNNMIDGGREYGFDPMTRNVTTVRSQSRLTSSQIDTLMNAGMTKAQIRDGLERIIRDNGAENTANAKKVETTLDDSLMNGYQSMQGRIPKNLDYAYHNADIGKMKNAYSKLDTEEAFANASDPMELIDEMEYLKGKMTERQQLIDAYSELLPDMSAYETMSAEQLHEEMSKLENASQYAPDEIAGEMMKRHRYLELLEEGRVNEFIENENMQTHISNMEKQLADKKLTLKLPRASEDMKNIQKKLDEIEAKQAGISIFNKATDSKTETVPDGYKVLPTAPKNRAVTEESSTVQYTDFDISQMPEDVQDFYNMVNESGYGFKLRVVTGIEHDANGMYDGQGNILIDGNKMTDTETISKVIAHEGFHYLKGTGEHKYIIDLAIDYLREKTGLTKEQLMQSKYNRYANAGVYLVKEDGTMDTDAVLDEIGAEFMQEIMSDPAVAERVWNQNRTLAERIKQWFEDMVSMIRGKANDSDIYRKALDAYQQGLRNMQWQNQGIGETRYSAAKLGGYFPDNEVSVDDVKIYGIKDINDKKEVIAKLREVLSKSYLSTKEQSKPIVNLDTGMEIEITMRGVKETFGKDEYYTNLSEDEKLVKIASMSKLANLIKYGEVRAQEAPNYHDPNSKVRYAYLKAPLRVDGQEYTVNMDIRKSPNGENRFYIHSLQINKNAVPNHSAGPNRNNGRYRLKNGGTTSFNGGSIPQNQQKVNGGKRFSLDTSGRQLTAEQADYFKNSKARDENGNLLVMYHGTDADFTVFDKAKAGQNYRYSEVNGKAGFFFTSKKGTAENYAALHAKEGKGNVMEVYLNIENPIYEYLESEEYYKPADIYDMRSYDLMMRADNNGNDGIIIESPKSVLCVVFSPEQIKNVDNQKPTGSSDIRYSLPSDSSGRKLSKEQAQYFQNSKARDKQGNLKVVYHGTRKADFTVFNRNVNYFTDSKEMADSYSPNGDMYEGYVNITKPYEIDAAGEKWSKIPVDANTKRILEEYGSSVFKEGGKWRTTPADIASAIEEAVENGDMDYDGIIIKNIDDTGSYYQGKDKHLATDYIVFNSNQFKNADNAKPTSDNDIRYSLPSDKEYLDAVNRGDMVKADEMIEEAAKKAGYTVKGYHGTVSNFTVFDISKTEATSNWGRGFYFTTSEEDVERNYATEDGPDLATKIDRLAERMEWMDGYEDLDYDERLEKAREMLITSEPRTIHAALRMENPVEFGGKNETFFDYEEEYDEETEEYTGETSGLLQEFMDELQDELWERGIDPSNFELWSIVEEAYGGGLWASDLEKKAREALIYVMDYDDGDIDAGEILSSTFDRMGFDGIIDHNVKQKFSSMKGLYEDTTHYIVFSPSQVKQTDTVTYDDAGNIIPLSKRFDTSEVDIRYSLDNLVDEYGAIPKGEDPYGTNRDIDIPQQTADDNRVSRFGRTAAESSNVHDEAVDEIVARMERGEFTYEPSGNQEQIDRANGLINHTGWERQLEQFQNKYRSGQALTADDIVLGERLIQEAQSHGDYKTAVDLIADIAAIGTELGRAVQALSVLKRLTPQGKVQALKRVEERINSGLLEQGKQPVKLPDEMLEQMLQAESEQMQSEIWDKCIENVANQVPATLADKINAWRYLAMLSNPKTHVRNTVGSGVMMGVSAVKRSIQTRLENRLLTAGEERYAELNRNVPQEYFDFAEWAFENDGKHRVQVGGGRYSDAIGQIEQNKRIFKNDKLEKARKTNTELLEQEDMMFKKKTFIDTLARYMYTNGLSPSALQDTASNASYEKGVEYATSEAFRATFQEASKVANLLAQMENSSPVAKVVMGALVPFKKTPINILKRGVEYSPVGLMNGLYKMRHDVQTGKMTKAEAIDAISAGLTGTGIMVLGYFMASMGMITAGAGEDDERKQWYDQQMGSQNYALVLPNGGTATIDWLAPSVMPLMAGAELYKQLTSENPANENSSAVTSVLEAISKVANPVLEMSMLQGVTDALQSYNSGTTGVLSDLITSTATSYGGQFVPAPVGALARTVDDTVRSSYAPKDSALTKTGEKFLRQQANKLPFVSMLMQPSIDVWGNEVERAGGNIVGRAFNNFINPATYSGNKKTDLDNKLNELYKATGNSGVLPKSATQYINETESNPKIQLSAREYAKYGTTQGQKSHQYVSAFVNSYAYSQMADEDKAEIVSDLYSLANYQAKKEALNGRGYDYTNNTYEKVLKSGMDPQNYYIVKYEMDVIADKVTTGQKSQQIAYLQQLQNGGIITNEQFWYLRRAMIGKFSNSEMAACPYAWIKQL